MDCPFFCSIVLYLINIESITLKDQSYILSILFIFFLLTNACKNSKLESLRYIDKEKPGLKPKLFAKDFITKKERAEFGSVFNKEGTEFYYADDTDGKAKILASQIVNGKWTTPISIIEDDVNSFNDPFLSPDEERLYYISDKPRNAQDTIKDYDIWYSKREGKDWSSPINAGPVINTDSNEFYISFTNSGTMFFASNKNKKAKRQHDFDIYRSESINGKFSLPEKLSDSINSKRYEADVFIAPDERYIIFCSARREGYGSGDLYISFKDDDGSWTTAQNLGDAINSEKNDICPFVTYDYKYFFYTSSQDIYWVSTDYFKQFQLIEH